MPQRGGFSNFPFEDGGRYDARVEAPIQEANRPRNYKGVLTIDIGSLTDVLGKGFSELGISWCLVSSRPSPCESQPPRPAKTRGINLPGLSILRHKYTYM